MATECGSITELSIGPDKVFLTGEVVTILALHEMPDFTLREFSRMPIFFEGKKYYLCHKTPGPRPFAFRYDIAPWPAGPGLESELAISYDVDYVAEREASRRADIREEQWHSILMPVYPLLGLFWSRFKARTLGRIGFDPVSITEASIMLLFGFFLLEGVFVLYFRPGFLGLIFSREWLLWLDLVLFVVLPIDCMVRYGHHPRRFVSGRIPRMGFQPVALQGELERKRGFVPKGPKRFFPSEAAGD